MQVNVFDLNGNSVKKIELPVVFQEAVREDLIKRAVLSSQSKRRQPSGTDPLAGQRTSAHYHGYRRHRWAMMGKEMARLPRIHGKASPHLMWMPRFAPQVKGGREAHPPKVEKIWEQRINDKERRKAVISAIAASSKKEFVEGRGHKISNIKELPIVVEDKIQNIKKTKELLEFLRKIGLDKELSRIQEKKIRAGKGKVRGRKYKGKVGPLFVITEDNGIGKTANGVSGMNVCRVNNLSTEALAPGTVCGRLTIWSLSSIEKLNSIYS